MNNNHLRKKNRLSLMPIKESTSKTANINQPSKYSTVTSFNNKRIILDKSSFFFKLEFIHE